MSSATQASVSRKRKSEADPIAPIAPPTKKPKCVPEGFSVAFAALALLKGSDADQETLGNTAEKDEDYFTDEFDDEDMVDYMRKYWRSFPADFSWDKYANDLAEFKKWEGWLITRGANYLYVDYKHKEALQDANYCGDELYIKLEIP